MTPSDAPPPTDPRFDRDNHPRNRAQAIAAVSAGHDMAQMPLTAEDVAALVRIDSGQSTVEDELERRRSELVARRSRA